ncbi:hypothetical protein PG997_004087 [Apiospora hydei]|uniref:Uncharacterized protein n=1 Tax=Apiospora hydei TaxID=1337664 RepID=A0ABR1X148_9PEZI
MATYISRVISMRDVDRPRTQPVNANKRYAVACPVMDDDTDSSDADDEYSPDDEFLIIPSGTGSEPEDGCGDVSYTDSGSDLEIIDDYFETMLPLQERELREITCEDGETQAVDPPVLKLNLACHIDVAAEEGPDNDLEHTPFTEEQILLALEESAALRDGTIALQQSNEEDRDNGSDSWSVASSCSSDSWAFETEAAEEEGLTVAKARHSQQAARHTPQLTRSNRPQGRRVAFALRPEVFGE